MKRFGWLIVICLISSPLFAQEQPTQQKVKKPIVQVDSYAHVGILNSPDTPDELRMLSLFNAGVTVPLGDRFGIRGGAGSILGLLGPSFELSAALEWFPTGVSNTSPMVRLGGRGIWNVIAECADDESGCVRSERAGPDAIGPTVAGGVGEASAGLQVKLSHNLYALAWGSYLAGWMSPVGADNPVDGGFYHGWLVHAALKFPIF